MTQCRDTLLREVVICAEKVWWGWTPVPRRRLRPRDSASHILERKASSPYLDAVFKMPIEDRGRQIRLHHHFSTSKHEATASI